MEVFGNSNFELKLGRDLMLEKPNAGKISTNQNCEPFLLAKCLSHKIEVNINSKIRILNKVIFTAFIYRGGDS